MNDKSGSFPNRRWNGHDYSYGSDRAILWIGAVGLLLTGLIAVWFGPNSEFRLEERVQRASQAALAQGGFGWAEATAHGQRVDLTGAAPSAEGREAAITAVKTALGPGGVFNGGVTKVIASNLDVVPVVSPFAWGAIKEDRSITLEGVAPTRSSRDRIEASARELFGAPNVTSRMSLGSGAPDEVEWADTAIAALTALASLQRGSAELIGPDMTVTGVTNSEDIAAKAREQLAETSTGANISAFISGPAEWSASLSNGRLQFKGSVESEATKQTLADLATDFFAAEFSDETAISAVGPWRARVQAALPNFARFQSGQISVYDKTMRISGDAAGSVLSFLREDMNKISDGYTVMYNVREIAPAMSEISDVDLSVTGEQRQASCQEAFTQVMAANEILFDSGMATIDRQSGETLDKLVEVARRCSDMRIAVQGHTDATGLAADNRVLSRERADAVRTYLTARGVNPDQVTTDGFGEDRPVATNQSERGRARNRRIEFKITSAENR